MVGASEFVGEPYALGLVVGPRLDRVEVREECRLKGSSVSVSSSVVGPLCIQLLHEALAGSDCEVFRLLVCDSVRAGYAIHASENEACRLLDGAVCVMAGA